MEQILACIDSSAYAAPVCDLAAWAAHKLELPVEVLHVVQRKDAVAERRDLSGAIGLGVKSSLLEELTRLEETHARLEVERGRALLAAAAERVQAAGIAQVETLHRHGGVVETILERQATAHVVVIGKRGVSQEFAAEHIGSQVERVVRASSKPILIASRVFETPGAVVLAYDGSKAAERALERCATSPLFRDLPVHIVMAGAEDERNRRSIDAAVAALSGRSVMATLRDLRAEELIIECVARTPAAMLVMGAYGHSPLRRLIVGSTTTAMIRTVHVPVMLVR